MNGLWRYFRRSFARLEHSPTRRYFRKFIINFRLVAKKATVTVGFQQPFVTCQMPLGFHLMPSPEQLNDCATFQRRTGWRVDYDALNHLAETQNGNGENAKSKPPKSQTPKSEIASSTTLKEHKELKEVITPPSGANVVKAFVDAFVSLYNEQPDKQLIGRIGRDAKRMLSEGKELAILIASAEACAQSGHGNLPASYTQTITAGKRNAPRGFAGIKEFLEDLNDAS